VEISVSETEKKRREFKKTAKSGPYEFSYQRNNSALICSERINTETSKFIMLAAV
jgi:hypothetical protein